MQENTLRAGPAGQPCDLGELPFLAGYKVGGGCQTDSTRLAFFSNPLSPAECKDNRPLLRPLQVWPSLKLLSRRGKLEVDQPAIVLIIVHFPGLSMTRLTPTILKLKGDNMIHLYAVYKRLTLDTKAQRH